MKTVCYSIRIVAALLCVWGCTHPCSTLAQEGPGQALVFESAGSRLIGQTALLPPPWTVQLWVKRRDSAALSAPLFLNATHALKLEQFGPGRRVGFSEFGVRDYAFDYTVPTNEWTHLTFAANESEICLFTNGGFHSCLPFSMDLPLDYFGSAPSRTNDQLRADVDEIRVWNRELVQVLDDIHRRISGMQPGVLVYWRCDETNGNSTVNTAANNLLPNTLLRNVGRIASGVPFGPEFSPGNVTLGTPTEFTFSGRLHPGNLPTSVRFLTGSSLQMTNAGPPEIVDTPREVTRSVPITPNTRLMLGRWIVSNALGMAESKVFRAVAPAFNPSGAVAWSNECHTPLANPGVTARMAPVGLAAGFFQSLILGADGSVQEWGEPTSPAPPTATALAALSAFDYQRVALRTDGTVLSWGMAGEAPAYASPAVAIAAGSKHALALAPNGTVVGWGENTHGQTTPPAEATNIVAIAAGVRHSIALNSQGKVLAWGAFGGAQVPADLSRNVVAIASGGYFGVALLADGTVRAWGDNSYGQLLIPPGTVRVTAVAAGNDHVLALLPGGKVRAWGQNNRGQCVVPAGLSNVVAIAAGAFHSLALLATGEVIAWGDNSQGQCDVPTPDPRLVVPITLEPGSPLATTGPIPVHFVASNSLGIFWKPGEVDVIDTTAPKLTVCGNNPYRTYLHVPFVDPGASTEDGCDPNVTATIEGQVDVSRLGNYSLTYTARDAAGNVSTASRLVIVESWPFQPGDTNGDGQVDRNELAAVLEQYYSRHAVLMTNAFGLGSSNVFFSTDVDLVGPEFEVEYSTNLVQWLPLGSAMSGYRFTDPGAGTGAARSVRVYRLRSR